MPILIENACVVLGDDGLVGRHQGLAIGLERLAFLDFGAAEYMF